MSKLRSIILSTALASVSALSVFAQTQDDSGQALAKLVANMARTERATLADICTRRPLVETYLQNVVNSDRIPGDDHYFLSRVQLGKELHDVLFDDPAAPAQRGQHQSILRALNKVSSYTVTHAPPTYDPHAFVEMLSPDVRGFKPENYTIAILRQEFLGDIPTTVLNVEPKKKGLFRGRMWVEREGHIVRFMGIFGGESSSHPRFVHFDSWRTNVGPGLWLPSSIYIEQPVPGAVLHGQIRIWGYGIDERERYASTHVSVHVDGATDSVDDSTNVDPLIALHQWENLASDNVLSKMESAGILAPEGAFEKKILDQIVINLSVPSDLSFSTPIKCRVMLTTPLEAMTVGNTIIVSKGLIETLPNEEAIASVLAFEMGHILTGTGIDTKYSFGDRTMVKDSDIYRSLPLAHSTEDDQKAAERAVELLKKSMYADKLGNVGLYYRQFAVFAVRLKELYRPRIGDALISSTHTPWLLPSLEPATPALEPSNLQQVAALPLGSNLVVEPWSGEVSLSGSARSLPTSIQEKRPFEVMPVYFRLRRSVAPADAHGESAMTENDKKLSVTTKADGQ